MGWSGSARNGARPGGVSRSDAEDARTRAVAWARAAVADAGCVYLDTETTGLGGDAEIVDLALVGGDGRVLLETLVRPVGPIPAEASRVHGIGAADVRHAPGWEAVHRELCRLLRGRRVIVYNAAYDQRIVAQCCDRHALAVPVAAWHCAMRQYAAYHGERDARRGGYRWHRLDQAVTSFGAPVGGHRALSDALACRAVVLGMAAAEE